MEDARLSIEIKNTRPIALADLTQSLLSLSDEFGHHIDLNEPEAAAAEVTLYLDTIQSGSIYAEILAISPQLIQGISYLNAVIGFSQHLKSAYDYLTGKSGQRPSLDKISYEHLTQIVEPIARDRGSQLNIGTLNGPMYVSINSTDANAAQNAARREIDNLREPTSRLHEKVLLYWYQARADASSKVGDRGIIESITKSPVKVVCANDHIKAKMILDDQNPFRLAYVVDVLVETIRERPALYNILAVHDTFEREEGSN